MLTRAALEERIADLEAERGARAALGRPPAAPLSADALLVARVCAALSLRRGALAARLGVTGGILSRCNDVPLAERHREAMRAMLAEVRGNKPKQKKNGRHQKSF